MDSTAEMETGGMWNALKRATKAEGPPCGQFEHVTCVSSLVLLKSPFHPIVVWIHFLICVVARICCDAPSAAEIYFGNPHGGSRFAMETSVRHRNAGGGDRRVLLCRMWSRHGSRICLWGGDGGGILSRGGKGGASRIQNPF